MTSERMDLFKKNQELEQWLNLLNNHLEISEKTAISEFTKPNLPLIFIVGCPRSGSTVLHQWLANLGVFAYPTNLLSRFYQAPYLGAIIQELITNPKFDYQGELFDLKQNESTYSSLLGKTKGALSPHGFHSFWRRFFHYTEIQFLTDEELVDFDKVTFLSELAAMEHVFKKPLAFKSLFLSWNISFIHQILSNAVFLYISRDPIYNTQSLLQARMDYYGSMETWYSYKPLEYHELQLLDPYSQVAGQIFYMNKAIKDQLSSINERHWLNIDYSIFCRFPESIYYQLTQKMKMNGFEMDQAYEGPGEFTESGKISLSKNEIQAIENAFSIFEK